MDNPLELQPLNKYEHTHSRLAMPTYVVTHGTLCEKLRVVDSLSTRQDFLTTHEHVVGVREFLIKKKKGETYIIKHTNREIINGKKQDVSFLCFLS